jgi:hypothetical protein
LKEPRLKWNEISWSCVLREETYDRLIVVQVRPGLLSRIPIHEHKYLLWCLIVRCGMQQ